MSTERRPGIGEDAAARTIAAISATVGSRLREARRHRGWTQAEVASRAGVSAQAVHAVERGRRATLGTIVAIALALRLEPELVLRAPRRHAPDDRQADVVHAAMGELEADALHRNGFAVAVDEPYQHYRFAGRADVVAWRTNPPALLHIENRTRFPDIQGTAGAWNAKCAWLGERLAERNRVGRWASETHVMACLWSDEVVTALARHPATFRSLAPDAADPFDAWWRGEPPPTGRFRTLVLIDPRLRRGRLTRIALDDALTGSPPAPYRGYSDAAHRVKGR